MNESQIDNVSTQESTDSAAVTEIVAVEESLPVAENSAPTAQESAPTLTKREGQTILDEITAGRLMALAKYKTIDAGLAVIDAQIAMLTDEAQINMLRGMRTTMRDAQLLAEGLSGDVDEDQFTLSDHTPEERDAALAAVKNPIDEFAEFIDKQDKEPALVNALATLQHYYDLRSQQITRHNVGGRVGKTVVMWAGVGTGDKNAPNYARLVTSIVRPGAGGTSRKSQSRATRVLPNLDVTAKSDSLTWKLRSNDKRWWLIVTDELGRDVYTYNDAKTLSLVHGDIKNAGGGLSLNQAVNAAIKTVKGNKASRSVPEVFAGHNIQE